MKEIHKKLLEIKEDFEKEKDLWDLPYKQYSNNFLISIDKIIEITAFLSHIEGIRELNIEKK